MYTITPVLAAAPGLGGLSGLLKVLTFLALLAGPVLMAIFGFLYLKRPNAEGNRNLGPRIFCGTGSAEAWQFTRRLSGLVFGGLGLGLTAIMLIVAIIAMFQALNTVANIFLICMIIEAVLTVAAYAAVNIIVAKNFDRNGNRKK